MLNPLLTRATISECAVQRWRCWKKWKKRSFTLSHPGVKLWPLDLQTNPWGFFMYLTPHPHLTPPPMKSKGALTVWGTRRGRRSCRASSGCRRSAWGGWWGTGAGTRGQTSWWPVCACSTGGSTRGPAHSAPPLPWRGAGSPPAAAPVVSGRCGSAPSHAAPCPGGEDKPERGEVRGQSQETGSASHTTVTAGDTKPSTHTTVTAGDTRPTLQWLPATHLRRQTVVGLGKERVGQEGEGRQGGERGSLKWCSGNKYH